MNLPEREPHGFGQSSLVLGGAQLGGAYGIANVTGAPDEAATDALLTLATTVGVTHLDTARAYGDSERNIGASLRRTRIGSLKVVTKIAPGADVRSSLRASLDHLRTATPPTVLFHRAADALTGWSTLRDLRDEGVAERIGVSVQSPAELLRVIGLTDLGYIQLPCNLLDYRWRTGDISGALAHHKDVVVTVRSVYLQGLLAAGTAIRWPHLTDAERDDLVAGLDRLAGELGREDRADLCVAYILGLPWVTSVVIGAESTAQLGRNADLAGRKPLTPDECAAVDADLPTVTASLLDPSTWPRS
jgi:aryl-alcohol dehydrogenase-like predicted oxidoreductase